MRLWRIPGMPARCSAFLPRILKLHFRLRRVPAPLTNLLAPPCRFAPFSGLAAHCSPVQKVCDINDYVYKHFCGYRYAADRLH